MHPPSRRETIAALTAMGLTPSLLCAQDAPAEPDDGAKPPERTLTNVRLIFHGLPPELNPHPQRGWDKFDLPKVKAWLDLTWIGCPVKITRRLHSVQVNANGQAKSRDEAWQVYITPAVEGYRFRDLEIDVSVGGIGLGNPTGHFRFVGDEAFAKRCERLPKNKILVVTGEIAKVELKPSIDKEDFELKFGLTKYAIPGVA